MTPRPPARPPARRRGALGGSDPELLTRAAAALIVALSVSLLLLGWGYARAVREQRAQALDRAQEIARILVAELVNEASGRSWAFLVEALVPAFTATPSTLSQTVARMEARAREYAANCDCVAPTPVAIVLLDASRGRLVEAVGPARRPLGADALRAIRNFADTAAPDIRRIAVIGVSNEQGPVLLHLRAVRAATGDRIVAAVATPMDQLADRVLIPARELVAARVFPAIAQRDSLFGVRLRFGDALTLFETSWFGDGIAASIPYWTTTHPLLTAEVRLRPEYLDLTVPGGVRKSRDLAFAGLSLLLLLLASIGVLLLRRARQLVMTRTLFLSGISHEMRTPLTQILLYAELLALESSSSSQGARSANVIVRETRRLIHLVENALLFARGGHDRLTLTPTDESLAALTAQCLEDFGPMLEQRQVRLETTLDPGAIARVDPHALRQVLVNLLDNAVRYGPAGQCVRVGATVSGQRVELSVEDEGPGIPTEVRLALERGLPRRTAHSETGTGIGLALVRELCAGMGGTLRIEDAPDGGARIVAAFERADRPLGSGQ